MMDSNIASSYGFEHDGLETDGFECGVAVLIGSNTELVWMGSNSMVSNK